MNACEDQKTEQNLAEIRDRLPHFLRALYEAAISIGFSKEQSFDLLKTYIQDLLVGNVTVSQIKIEEKGDG